MLKITPPGSKSITNRALVLAALVRKTVTIKNAAICEDSTYMIKCLKKLGIRIEQKGETIKIKGCGGKFPKSDRTIKLHTGNAGTTTRFITALATLTDNKVVIDGDSRMRQRPIKELSDALNQLGADTKTTKNCPPVKIQPKIPEGGTVKIRGDLSSQYISALMMIAPHTKKPTKIQIEQKTCSKPYIKLTKTMIKSFDQQPSSYNVESDASGASYFGAYAALNPQKTILLNNIFSNSIQGDIIFLELLKKMGCKTKETKNGTLINGPKKLTPLRNIDLNHAPDLVMTFAILAIFCKGKTTIKNISNLKIKETDRIVALKNEISKLGIKVSISSSSITIHGDPKHNFPSKTITIKTYNDHRIAMCFGILQHAIPNLKIENPSCVKKSYPNFWNDLRKLQNKNIILTGMRGSGKTKLGKMLSKKIKKKFIDLDKEIEKLAKSKIKNIVKEKGWDHFRKLEKQISKNFSMQDNLIIATGGGTIINNENYQAFKQNSIIIYLHRLPANSLKYIANDKNRPNLTKEKDQLKDLEKTYKARKETYRQRADHTIKRTDDLEQDLGQILNLLNHPLS